jgi:hypothetical protein
MLSARVCGRYGRIEKGRRSLAENEDPPPDSTRIGRMGLNRASLPTPGLRLPGVGMWDLVARVAAGV